MASQEETEDYMAAFDAFKGDDKCLDTGEFVRLLVALGVEGGADTAHVILENVNKTDDGKITRGEFIEAIKQPGINNIQIRNLKQIFDQFDHDSSGWVSVRDVIDRLPQLGLSEEQVKKQVDQLDGNRDGRILFHDFLRVQLRI